MPKDAEPLPEEKFSQSLFEDVFNQEGESTDLDMYLIQTEELKRPKDDSQVEHEMQLLFAMNHSFCEDSALLEEERKRLERQEEVLALARKFKLFTHRTDDYRCPNASYYGGF